MGEVRFQPSWWNDQLHGSAWRRVKEAMRRDWEQTRADLTGAPDLHQDVDDTIKQALGKAPIPPPGEPTPASRREAKRAAKQADAPPWDDVESPLSFGYAARSYYAASYPHWDERLESELREEWNRAHPNGQPFDDVKPHVRRGFDAPHR
ncbi:MAG: hypothetical protein Q8O67_02645 [Deltaproteobacteria bacterium]|nr:hypothetical protein [Deltaproteobacteria bacterium]